ncbi:MAG: MFS transporter [Gemmatimonadota bacterium]
MTTSPPARDPYVTLRDGNVRRYLAGNVLATLGQQMQTVAVGWELYERTHSAWALGLVGLMQVIPIIIFTLPSGQIVDRYDRRRVLMAANLVMAIGSLGLAAASYLGAPVAATYASLFIFGTGRAFQGPAKQALLPLLVRTDQFTNAVTWNSGGWQAAAVLGPALGGMLLGWTHSAVPVYLIDAAAALTFFFLARTLQPRSQASTGRPTSWEGLLDGFRYVTRTKVLLAAITLDLFAVLLGGATTLLPVFAKDILHVGPTGLGWLLAAQAVGAVSMSVMIAHRPPFERAGRTLLLAVTGFGLATIVFGLSRSYVLSFVMLLIAGSLDSISVVIRLALAQLKTPDSLRGRVSSVNSLFIGTSNELGGFESGAVASAFGPVVSVVAGGIGTILVVTAVALAWPEIVRLRRLEEGGEPDAA